MIDFNKFCNSETLYDIKNINHVESDLYVKNGVMYKNVYLSYGQLQRIRVKSARALITNEKHRRKLLNTF